MAHSPLPPPLQQRLSEQLRALSEVSETLTIRLLELEERLQRAEHHLEQVGREAQGDSELPGSTGQILAQTEARLARLEDWLQDHQGARARSAPSVLPFPRSVAGEADNAIHQGDFGVDPFPDEAEQRFMDELSA
ncbi:hypothetical protein [Cyanobium sp. Morenito 9A2]|uniref:hypothetical protein n=1 Tax=Cyanobium sp. Morenito 9A2 TaxID=2823718 RepID=UPI0020CF8B34|nr:hypothetical protein [Cyanobium sp. Morenito 9A2]MCP9851174.1 hypothetical protein [Cyanobium sp. Morenito 9A2]